MPATLKRERRKFMQGLELSGKYWEQCGRPVFERNFPEVMRYIAVALTGAGSDAYGFDDSISQDHDFSPGFMVFLPGEDEIDSRTQFLLERAYATLPKEFEGFRRESVNPAGGARRGIFRTAEYFKRMSGIEYYPMDAYDFLRLPDSSLFELTNGGVFYDNYGEFSAIRDAWSNPPTDVTLKRLAGYLMDASQAGQYNFPRIASRGDGVALQLCKSAYIKAALGAFFWANGRYMPYYKWAFSALLKIPDSAEFSGLLSSLAGESGNSRASDIIKSADGELISCLKRKGFIPEGINELQRAAFYLNGKIADPNLRNSAV